MFQVKKEQEHGNYRISEDGKTSVDAGAAHQRAYEQHSWHTSTLSTRRDHSPWIFFPIVTKEEMVTWTHWLPTCMVFDCASVHTPADVISTLTQLKAPPEVLEEFHWSWKLGLFESYEIRTPVRTDARDPLLLGRVGEQRYRLALWGESLLPLEQITTLVQQSLALKTRVEKRKGWTALGGALFGLAVGLLWAWLSPMTQPIGISFLFAFVGFFPGLAANVPLYAGESPARFSRSLSLLAQPAVSCPGQQLECYSRSRL